MSGGAGLSPRPIDRATGLRNTSGRYLADNFCPYKSYIWRGEEQGARGVVGKFDPEFDQSSDPGRNGRDENIHHADDFVDVTGN